MKYRLEFTECESLYDVVRAGLALNGKVLERAAAEAGLIPAQARQVALGAFRGKKRHEIEEILLKMAGAVKIDETEEKE
jgi:hypothetical protein